MSYMTVGQIKSNPLVAILTGHTCGEACWHAREDICRCSCGGKNHGILNNGQPRPERTCKKAGKFYVLAGVAPDWRAGDKMVKEIIGESFPGLDYNGYGEYGECLTMPVLSRKASANQLKWPEVSAIESNRDKYLIWRLPKGEKYITKHSGYYSKEPALFSEAL